MLKSPEDFFKSLKSGKIRPTDCLLVKENQSVEWIPVREIHQFRLETRYDMPAENKDHIINPDGLFDHIRQPRFNVSALALGGFWYFWNDMPRLALRRLLLAAGLICFFFSIGIAIGLSFVQCLPFLLAGWLASAVFCAIRADHDLNCLQVERFHRESPQIADNQCDTIRIRSSTHPPREVQSPIGREKVLN